MLTKKKCRETHLFPKKNSKYISLNIGIGNGNEKQFSQVLGLGMKKSISTKVGKVLTKESWEKVGSGNFRPCLLWVKLLLENILKIFFLLLFLWLPPQPIDRPAGGNTLEVHLRCPLYFFLQQSYELVHKFVQDLGYSCHVKHIGSPRWWDFF